MRCKPDYKYYDEKPYDKKPYYGYKKEEKEECDACDCKPETCKRKECHFCPKPVIFECACGTGTIIGEVEDDAHFNPVSLGCLTIDTTCLCKPMVKFDFSSIISFKAEDTDDDPIILTFTLTKICDGGFPVRCGSWDFRVLLDDDDEEITTSFTFTHCECSSCPGCCVYTVEITRAVNDSDSDLSICNVVLSAIATSSC